MIPLNNGGSSLQGFFCAQAFGFTNKFPDVSLTLTISKNFPEFLGNSLTLKNFHSSLTQDCHGQGKDFPYRGANPCTAFNRGQPRTYLNRFHSVKFL